MVHMLFLRVTSEGLAHISYFIGSGSEAAVIDPRRDIDVYLDIARKHCMRIKYIFETHRKRGLRRRLDIIERSDGRCNIPWRSAGF